MQIMIKVSDVSNEARPMDVAEPWLDCLLQEFFIQVGVVASKSKGRGEGRREGREGTEGGKEIGRERWKEGKRHEGRKDRRVAISTC